MDHRISDFERLREFVQRGDQLAFAATVLYSKDWTDSGKTASGSYEVISEEMNE